jgi:hypothetical protein
MIVKKVLNSIAHRLRPILYKFYYKSRQHKKFDSIDSECKLMVGKTSILYDQNQICEHFEYKDESWNGIKYIGDILWNDTFRYLPIFKRDKLIDLEKECINRKVNFNDGEIHCKSSGIKNDWIFLKNKLPINSPYAIEFEAKILYENSEFQFAFFYQNLGRRYRFNLKDNRWLSFEIIEDGFFHNDIFKVPLSLPIDEWVHFKIIVDKDKYLYSVDNIDILCVKQLRDYPKFNTTFALVLWDSHYSNIDTKYKNLKLYKI